MGTSNKRKPVGSTNFETQANMRLTAVWKYVCESYLSFVNLVLLESINSVEAPPPHAGRRFVTSRSYYMNFAAKSKV